MNTMRFGLIIDMIVIIFPNFLSTKFYVDWMRRLIFFIKTRQKLLLSLSFASLHQYTQ